MWSALWDASVNNPGKLRRLPPEQATGEGSGRGRRYASFMPAVRPSPYVKNGVYVEPESFIPANHPRGMVEVCRPFSFPRLSGLDEPESEKAALRFRLARAYAGTAGQNLGAIAGVAECSVAKYANGYGRLGKPVLRLLARHLAVDPAWLIGGYNLKMSHGKLVCIAPGWLLPWAFPNSGDDNEGVEKNTKIRRKRVK